MPHPKKFENSSSHWIPGRRHFANDAFEVFSCSVLQYARSLCATYAQRRNSHSTFLLFKQKIHRVRRSTLRYIERNKHFSPTLPKNIHNKLLPCDFYFLQTTLTQKCRTSFAMDDAVKNLRSSLNYQYVSIVIAIPIWAWGLFAFFSLLILAHWWHPDSASDVYLKRLRAPDLGVVPLTQWKNSPSVIPILLRVVVEEKIEPVVVSFIVDCVKWHFQHSWK